MGTNEARSAGDPERDPAFRRVSAGGRATRQRAVIVAELDRSPGFRSAQDLHLRLREEGHKVGLTTVYRHLQRLAEAGAVDVVRTPEGENTYRACETPEHHHHLVCRCCGRAQEVEGPQVEAWADHVASQAGYVDVGHTVEVFGVCGRCAQATDHGSA